MVGAKKSKLVIKVDLVKCVKDLYKMGYTSLVSGNHSIRLEDKNWMWLTPSGVPRYELKERHLVKVNLNTGKSRCTETKYRWYMYASIYKRSAKINAVVPTQSPYTLALAISAEKFQHVIEEAKVVVGNPIIVINNPSGSIDLANIVSKVFEERKTREEVRAVIIRNHGVVTVGNNIHQARAVVEALEEWAKILTISKIFDGPKYKP